MRIQGAREQPVWMENDLTARGRFWADWKPWPPVVFLGVVGLTLLFQVPLAASLAGGAAVALIMAVVGRLGERTVAAQVAVTANELRWVDRGGREHKISLTRIQEVKRIGRQEESVIWYLDEKGERRGLGVGPRVAEAVRRALNHERG